MANPPAAAVLAIAVLGLLAVPRCAAARTTAGEAFVCAQARSARAARGKPPLPSFHPRVGVTVVDRFSRPLADEHHTLDLRKPEAWCRPVRLDDTEPVDDLRGLETYAARRTRRQPPSPPFEPVDEEIVGPFGTVALRITGNAALGVPTTATGAVGGTDTDLDHFSCYDVRAADQRGRVRRVEVRSRDGRRLLDLRKPSRLCVPASVRGEDAGAPKHPLDLLCYDARPVRQRGAPKEPAQLLATRNDLGHEVLRVESARQLCVWAARADADLPTPTPLPTFTPPRTPGPSATPVRTPRPPALRIEPAVGTALVRDRMCFSARLELPDGTDVDVTAAGVWRVADGAVAAPAGVTEGKKCFVALAIGTTAISVRDPVTGLVGGDATLVGEWPIYALSVTPQNLGMRVGSARSLTATARFTGDRTRNVTQQVQWSSADPTVARAEDPAGNRSRVEAVARGRTVVTATDLLSSITGSTNVAVGALQSLQVQEPDAVLPGDTTELTTIAYYEEGFSDEIRQGLAYQSSDPDIADAVPVSGGKGIVTGHRPGHAQIDAIDLETGIRSACCGRMRVLGAVEQVILDAARPLSARLGIDTDPFPIRAYAVHLVPPDERVSLSAADRLTWLMDPQVAATAGVDRDRMRVVPVGGGVTSVAARDPASGVTSDALTMTVYGRLDRVDVGTSPFDPAALKEQSISIGMFASYYAYGFFDGANYLRLKDARFESSDPAIAGAGPTIEGLAPGTVTVSAIDGPSGKSSRDGGREAILHVRGPLERVELQPHELTMNLDQQTSLTAIGHYGGDATGTLTQDVIYTSSDPTVVEAPNAFPDRSAIRTRQPGVATISAYDPFTGVSSTDSGDDVTVTVRDEHLLRIVVSPPAVTLPVDGGRRFTATGHFTTGLTQNLTQRVEWTSSAPTVAGADNTQGDRSRVDAFGPGVATIAARDPLTGITSTSSDDDATVTVGVLTAITLAPAANTLAAGAAFSYTTTGTLDTGDTVNLTQDVSYESTDPTVAVATNLDGNRSRIVAVAPGTATITAHRHTTFPQVADSNPVTITVAP